MPKPIIQLISVNQKSSNKNNAVSQENGPNFCQPTIIFSLFNKCKFQLLLICHSLKVLPLTCDNRKTCTNQMIAIYEQNEYMNGIIDSCILITINSCNFNVKSDRENCHLVSPTWITIGQHQNRRRQ